MFNDVIISHFRKVLKRKEKQVTLDRFFSKRKEQLVTTSLPSKRLAREKTPPVELSDVFVEEVSPS